MDLAAIEWLAIERRTRQIVGYHLGGRDQEGALGLLLSIPNSLLEKSLVFTDDFPSYGTVFRKGQLQQEGKQKTTKIERINNTIQYAKDVVDWSGMRCLFLKYGKTTI